MRKITANNKYKELKKEMAEIASTKAVVSKAVDTLLASGKELLGREAEVKKALAKISSLKKQSAEITIEETEEGLDIDLDSGEAKQVVVDGDVIKGEEGEEEEEEIDFRDEEGDKGEHEDKFDFENIDGDEEEGEPEEVVEIEKKMRFLSDKYKNTKNANLKDNLKRQFNVLGQKRKRILASKKK